MGYMDIVAYVQRQIDHILRPFVAYFERYRQVLLIFVSVSRMLLTSLVQY